MNKIRVLHYLRNLALGGTEKTCQLFFEHADKSKFEVAVAYEKSGTHPRLEEFEKGAKVCGGKLFEVDSRPEHDIDYLAKREFNGKSLQAVIDDFKPDILHVYRSGYHEFPSPGHHVNVPHFVETNVFGFHDSNPKIDRTLFMSKWLMDYTSRKLGFKHNRFDFVNNPVEMPCTDDTLTIAKKWKSDGAIIAGRCGRPDNGIYNAVSVDAVRLLRMQGYDIRFIAVAPPSNMVDDLIRYEIPFYVVEPTTSPLVLSTFYNSVDIYTHARADGETFGVNIAEAMIHGKPVITHIAVPSVPGMGVFQSQVELVTHCETGFVVNNNPAEYAEALKHLIDNSDTRTKMGEAGQCKAEAEYEVKACMAKLERVYQEIA
jgi:glycosyltransferase involved in cell wall biosynthesis